MEWYHRDVIEMPLFGVKQRYLIGVKIRLRVRRHSALLPPMRSLRLTTIMALITRVMSVSV